MANFDEFISRYEGRESFSRDDMQLAYQNGGLNIVTYLRKQVSFKDYDQKPPEEQQFLTRYSEILASIGESHHSDSYS